LTLRVATHIIELRTGEWRLAWWWFLPENKLNRWDTWAAVRGKPLAVVSRVRHL